MAAWIKEKHDGQYGQRGLHGQQPGGLGGQRTKKPQGESTASTKSTPSTFPEIAANAALVLIAVAGSLLDRQLAALAAAFEHEGGFTERLYRVRKNARRDGR